MLLAGTAACGRYLMIVIFGCSTDDLAVVAKTYCADSPHTFVRRWSAWCASFCTVSTTLPPLSVSERLHFSYQTLQLAAHPCTVPSHSAMCRRGGLLGRCPPTCAHEAHACLERHALAFWETHACQSHECLLNLLMRSINVVDDSVRLMSPSGR